MGESLWKILAFLLCAILLFIIPLTTMLNRQDDVAYNMVLTECNRFVDMCRDTGYITPSSYLEFVSRINATGNTYKIKLLHIKRSVNPIYEDKNGVLVFTGQYGINHVTQPEYLIMDTLFPSDKTLSTLDISRRYNMTMGDLLFVEVQNNGKTMATALRDMLLFSDTKAPEIFVRSGGMVRNEAY
ncbi:MAG: hypothetical protein ACOYEI_00730 [Acetivibrionales bacterium]|jgi:hypothetical protein|nr:hypothetical protein [Clostridiaceae bacterium]